MPAFLAPLVGFALGALLAWLQALSPRGAGGRFAGASPAGSPSLRGRPVALAALFSGLVFTPICAYFLVFAPDWSFAYFIDTRRVPSALDLVLLAVDAASVPAGFVAAGRAAARRALRAAAALAAGPLGAALLVVLVLARRLAVDGTYRQVHGDFGTQPVAGGPLGYALLWMHALLAAGFAVTARALLAPPRAAGRPASESAGRAAPGAAAPDPERPAEPAGEPAPPPRRLGLGRSRPPRPR